MGEPVVESSSASASTPGAERPAPALRVVAEDETPESSRSAADVGRFVCWVAATFRPPQVWAERPASAQELLASARNQPEQGPARRAYALAAGLVTAVGVAAIWIAQSPARLGVGLLVGASVAIPLVALA